MRHGHRDVNHGRRCVNYSRREVRHGRRAVDHDACASPIRTRSRRRSPRPGPPHVPQRANSARRERDADRADATAGITVTI